MRFDDFKVGDFVSFETSFSQDDFGAFAKLSGDRNPLHGDADYASRSEFGRPIVPLHLVTAPLSRIAGMIFPGEPSLYLGVECRMPQAAFFGAPIVYSARIAELSPAQRLLRIRTLAFQANAVVLEATQQVQARLDEWKTPPELPIRAAESVKTVLVTGAAGAIGRAIALRLAEAGRDLILHARKSDGALEAIAQDCRKRGVEVATIGADLATERGRQDIGTFIQKCGSLAAIVHTASPGVSAPLQELVDVNFSALEEMAKSAIPVMLRQQAGTILFIGSVAVETQPEGWAAYSGAKAMGTSYAQGLDKAYGRYGVRGIVLAPGFVATRMSEKLRPSHVEALLPEEAAAHCLAILDKPEAAAAYASLRPGLLREGTFGFSAKPDQLAQTAGRRMTGGAAEQSGARQAATPAPPDATVVSFVRDYLGAADDSQIFEGGIDITPSWDSLKHIELILAIEKNFGIQFSSVEIEQTKTFRGLEKLVRTKIG